MLGKILCAKDRHEEQTERLVLELGWIFNK